MWWENIPGVLLCIFYFDMFYNSGHWGLFTNICFNELGNDLLPSQYQCWFIVNWCPIYKSQTDWNQDINICIQESVFTNVARKLAAILLWHQCIACNLFDLSKLNRALNFDMIPFPWFRKCPVTEIEWIMLKTLSILTQFFNGSGVILCMRPTNDRQLYNVMSSFIGWVHSQNDTWWMLHALWTYDIGQYPFILNPAFRTFVSHDIFKCFLSPIQKAITWANVDPDLYCKVPTLFPKWNSRTFQGLIMDKITFFKHYQMVIWYIVNVFFCDEITSHTPNYNIHHWKHGSSDQ